MEGHAEELAELHADFLEAAEEERPLDPDAWSISGRIPANSSTRVPTPSETRGLWPRDGDREDPAARWILAGLAGKRQDIDEMEEVYDHHTQRTLSQRSGRLRSPPARRLS